MNRLNKLPSTKHALELSSAEAEKKMLFVVSTRYHLLCAISIFSLHLEQQAVKGVILLADKGNGRLRNITLPVRQEVLSFRHLRVYGEEVRHILDELLQANYYYLFLFNEYLLPSMYLASNVNKDCIKALAEDGTAIYQKITRRAILSRLKHTFQLFRLAIKQRLLNTGLRFVDKDFGKMPGIDELWLTHPKLLAPSKYPLRKIPLLASRFSRDLASQLFNYKADDVGEIKLLHVARVSYGPDFLKEEIELLKRINSVTKHTLYIKKHPLTPQAQIDLYLKNGFSILQNEVPAEIIANELKGGIITSIDSTTQYFVAPDSKQFILFPFLQRVDAYPAWRTVPYPDHVKIITSEEQLQSLLMVAKGL